MKRRIDLLLDLLLGLWIASSILCIVLGLFLWWLLFLLTALGRLP